MTLGGLLTGVDITSRRGGPYPDDELTAAGADVRGACGWHVAPQAEGHEVLVSGPPGPRLVLPSLNVVDVAVRDVVTGVEITGWRRGASGMLIRPAGWPRGEDNLLITLTHGYERCPDDLIAVVLERTRALAAPAPAGARQLQKIVGGVTTNTTYTENAPAWSLAAESILARYRV